MATSPTRPQSPLGFKDAETERLLQYQYDHQGVCGKLTGFFLRNLALILLLVVGLLGLLCLFRAPFHAWMNESCRMHHDEFQGKLWLECPEALRQAFGPRR